MSNSKSGHVFVVGLPRTGTKLAVNVINLATEGGFQFIPENFFLGRFLRPGVRQKMRRLGSMTEDGNLEAFVTDMYSGEFDGKYWQMLRDGELNIVREVMLQLLLDSDRSEKAIYEVLLHAPAHNQGKIMGDKSGSHILHVPTILKWFPEAKIIHTFRDPRAILASQYRKLMRKRDRRIRQLKQSGSHARAQYLRLHSPVYSLDIVLYITINWLSVARLHKQYQDLFPDSYFLLKFEELITEPRSSLERLCSFLEIEFSEEMLNPAKVDSSYDRQVGRGLDKEALTRWQSYLKPWMKFWLSWTTRKQLREFGYVP